MTRRRYTVDEQAAALAALLSDPAAVVAARFRIPLSTIKSWQRRMKAPVLREAHARPDFGELLATHVRTSLQALTAQAAAVSDPDYLASVPADQLALLHGVMFDKAMRVLEALPVEGDW